MDYNPNLKPWLKPRPNDLVGGKGSIEIPRKVENIVWQTRAAAPSEYENKLGDALVECFAAGIVKIEPLVERLNAMGVLGPDGGSWTPASFEREMARLGA